MVQHDGFGTESIQLRQRQQFRRGGGALSVHMTQPGDESTGLYNHNVPSQRLQTLYSCINYINPLNTELNPICQ